MARRSRNRPDEAKIREHGRALYEAACEAASAARALVDDVEALARDELRERPLLALGAAFAAGWLLAGGLPARATGVLGGVVGRTAVALAATRLAGASAAPPAGAGAD